MIRPLILERFLIWWIAAFDLWKGPIVFGRSPEEAKANLIAQIARKEPSDLSAALGELATPIEILGAINNIHGMIHECERDAGLALMNMNRSKQRRLMRAADRWRRVVNDLERIAGVPCS